MFKFYIIKTILYCVTKIKNSMYNVQVLYNNGYMRGFTLYSLVEKMCTISIRVVCLDP